MSSCDLGRIEDLAKRIGRVEGVLAVVLFGSYARGDYDEGSDVDLLVVFEGQGLKKQCWEEVVKIASRTELFTQIIMLTSEELRSSQLLPSILREGRPLYAKEGFDLQRLASFKPHAIVTYSLNSMEAKEKVRLIHRLYGRASGKYRYRGLVEKYGGFRVGRNCFMIPLGALRNVLGTLEERGAAFEVRYVWIPSPDG
ncbi:TPA: nucleotidyltransferase domain-containing protein [Candidatus Bathyarchaeota archaeon]|nr:nucleotidyltransferase domain-containing protein [Candidatus Bathyarchaeota archaeon]